MFKILIPKTLSGSGVEYLKQKGCEIIQKIPVSKHDPILSQCDAILTGPSKFYYDEEVLRFCKNCKIIANFSAGVEHIDLLSAKSLGIQITNSGNANSNSVAEHTLSLLLACAKNLWIMSDAVKKGDFSVKKRVRNLELKGLTLGLIGCGNIGMQVAKKASFGFDMNVLAYDHHLTAENAPAFLTPVDTLSELYQSSDFISLHIPYTEKNKHLIAKKELEQMKQSAILINVSRGGIINETDLIDALKKGVIKGAGLDVFEQEPVSTDSELLTLSNLIVTPHCASNTEPSLHNMELYAAMDIWRVLHGEPPKFSAIGF